MNQQLAPAPVKELRLRPKVHPTIDGFLQSKEMLHELVAALGSPLNIVFPQLIAQNVEAFRECLQAFKLKGRVYFAHKANRSDSFVRELSLQQAYIDVSSANELKHALGCGFRADRIQATGPKNLEFIALCLLHGVTISVDSQYELSQILQLRRKLSVNEKTPVLLRICGFSSTHSNYRSKASRFGIPISDLDETLQLLENHTGELNFLGFAFHIDTVSIPEKVVAVENCLALFEEAFSRGLQPKVLNIGGGFKASYLSTESDWHAYTAAMRDAALGNRPPIAWQGNTFGLKADKGAVRGSFNSFSYYDPSVGAKFLAELLSYESTSFGEARIASLLRENGIELWLEPGRALLDQTGVTVGRVNSLRKSSHGETLVCLNMKRQDLCFLDQEIFVDPIVIRQQEPLPSADSPAPVYFAGNLCLESDLVYRHQTYLDALPEPDDLIVFTNTSAYFMDFSACEAIMQPTAKKIAITGKPGKFKWTMDEQYQPWLPASGE